jgi:2-keto-3-deoxy-L-rhamnonate aldolase RhmA
MEISFRQHLKDRKTLIGTVVTFSLPEVTEVLSGAGFDWLFLDAEHGPLDTLALQRLVMGAGSTPCLVRLAASSEVEVKKALDIGAAGIIAPQVNSAEQAAQVVRWAKYSPQGIRGVGAARAHGYGLAFKEYLATANDHTVVVVQAEHGDAVSNIEAIVQVAGIDAVLVGPNDLAASLGHLGDLAHPDVAAAIDRVTEVCRRAGMPLGIFGMNPAAVKPYLDRGYALIVCGVDTVLLGTAARELLTHVTQ